MKTVAEAQAELARQRGTWVEPAGRVLVSDRELMTDTVGRMHEDCARLYLGALRVIASGELSRGRAIEAAKVAIERGNVFRKLAARVGQ
jgi:hypothetical protein